MIFEDEWHILVENEYRHRILRKILYKNGQFHENPITFNSAALAAERWRETAEGEWEVLHNYQFTPE